MAIQIKYQDISGVTHSSAYSVIEMVQIFRTHAYIGINIYHDRKARDTGKHAVNATLLGFEIKDEPSFTIVNDDGEEEIVDASPNFTKFMKDERIKKSDRSAVSQAYEYAKILPLFEDGKDV